MKELRCIEDMTQSIIEVLIELVLDIKVNLRILILYPVVSTQTRLNSPEAVVS